MQKLSDLMQKEMTRKEFLATLGFGVATALGFSTLIRLVTGNDNNPFKQSSVGYGSGAYGGRKPQG
jgi:hypothetical protein